MYSKDLIKHTMTCVTVCCVAICVAFTTHAISSMKSQGVIKVGSDIIFDKDDVKDLESQIDMINDSLTWKKIGEATGSTKIPIEFSKYKEVSITVGLAYTGCYQSQIVVIPDTTYRFNYVHDESGYYQSVNVYVSDKYIQVVKARRNDSNVLANTNIIVYAR